MPLFAVVEWILCREKHIILSWLKLLLCRLNDIIREKDMTRADLVVLRLPVSALITLLVVLCVIPFWTLDPKEEATMALFV